MLEESSSTSRQPSKIPALLSVAGTLLMGFALGILFSETILHPSAAMKSGVGLLITLFIFSGWGLSRLADYLKQRPAA